MSQNKKSKKSKRQPVLLVEAGKPRNVFLSGHGKDFFVIVLVGMVLRIIYDIHQSTNPLLSYYVLDSLVLHSWALDILSGKSANMAFFRAPLYPYMLALLYKIFGVSPWSIISFQNALGIMTSIVTYSFAYRLFGRKTALLAGIVVAVYPTLIYFEGETMIATLAVFLYTLSIFLIWRAVQEPATGNILLAGLVVGLAAIARPAILPLAVLFPIGFLLKYHIPAFKECTRKSFILAIGIFLPILPVTFTNLVKGNEFVLISTQGGVNFYIGNSAEADGISVVAPAPKIRSAQYEDDIWISSVDEAERLVGRKLSQSEISSFWYQRAFQDIREDVGRATRLYIKKLAYFWHGQEIFNNKSLYFAGEFSWLMRILLWKNVVNFPSGFLFPLMLLGVFIAVRNRENIAVPALYLLLFGMLISLFFVCSRFRQPVIPIAAIFASYAIVWLRQFASGNRKRFATYVVILLGLVLVFNWGGDIESKENLSQFYLMRGTRSLNENRTNDAIQQLEVALDYAPDNGNVWETLGTAYLRGGELSKAGRLYRDAYERFPLSAEFGLGLGGVFEKLGVIDSSKFYYQQVLNTYPMYKKAIERMGHIYSTERNIDSALHYYEQLQRLMPRDQQLKSNIDFLKKAREIADSALIKTQ